MIRTVGKTFRGARGATGFEVIRAKRARRSCQTRTIATKRPVRSAHHPKNAGVVFLNRGAHPRLCASYRSGGTMCFLPNTQASIDHVPGPIIAKVAPRTARKRGRVAWGGHMKATLASSTAITAPAIGVHKPAISRTPAAAAILSGTSAAQIGFVVAQTTPQ